MLFFVLHASDLRQQAVTVIGGALGLGTNIFQHNLMKRSLIYRMDGAGAAAATGIRTT